MVAQILTRSYYAYTADDTNVYVLATTTQNGAVNGATAVAPNSHPPLPRGWVPRHVYGDDGSGNRTKVPIFNPSNGIFVGGTTSFTKNSTSYTTSGHIGEKRVYRGG